MDHVRSGQLKDQTGFPLLGEVVPNDAALEAVMLDVKLRANWEFFVEIRNPINEIW